MKSPAFRFYVDNFIEGTCDMSDSEVGLYMRLLCAQWSRGSLPNNDAGLARFSKGSTTTHTDLERVKEKFEVADDGKLRNRRLELERGKQMRFSEVQSQKGKRSAEHRFNPGSAPVQPRPGCPPVEPSVSVSASSNKEKEGRLHGIPETAEEVVAYGQTINPKVSAETCRDFFNHYESQKRTSPSGGIFWITSGEAIITDWKFKLPKFISKGGNHDNTRSSSKRTDNNSESNRPDPTKKSAYAGIGKV